MIEGARSAIATALLAAVWTSLSAAAQESLPPLKLDVTVSRDAIAQGDDLTVEVRVSAKHATQVH